VALAAALLTTAKRLGDCWDGRTSRQLVGGSWPDQSCLTVLHITKQPRAGPLVARELAGRVSVASWPQSGIIRNARLLRARQASHFVVGMLAPTSGDSLGTGERSGPRSLGVRAAPIFTSAPGLGKMNFRSLFRGIGPKSGEVPFNSACVANSS
jgi:hypothetical protein